MPVDAVPPEFFPHEDDQQTKALTRAIFAAMGKLSEGQREVLLLSSASGLDCDEVAEALGCSISRVKGRLRLARNEMQKCMAEELMDQHLTEPAPESVANIGSRVQRE